MADDESTSSGVSGPVHDLIAQLRGLTEKLTGLTGLTGLTDALPSLPRPVALSAAQLTAMTSTIAALRRSVDAMQAQLSAFDEQLAVIERILDPLTEWTNTLADLEKTVMNLRPGGEG